MNLFVLDERYCSHAYHTYFQLFDLAHIIFSSSSLYVFHFLCCVISSIISQFAVLSIRIRYQFSWLRFRERKKSFYFWCFSVSLLILIRSFVIWYITYYKYKDDGISFIFQINNKPFLSFSVSIFRCVWMYPNHNVIKINRELTAPYCVFTWISIWKKFFLLVIPKVQSKLLTERKIKAKNRLFTLENWKFIKLVLCFGVCCSASSLAKIISTYNKDNNTV